MRRCAAYRAAIFVAALLSTCASTLVFADGSLHALWQIQGKHNTVYLIGSIHVLRGSDYPLPKPLTDAYANSQNIVMEINLADTDPDALQQEMLQAASLPQDKTLHGVMGPSRFTRAQSLAGEVGVDLSMFDQFAPWFVAEAISQMQLMKLGFQPSSGVEMYFLEEAKTDRKTVSGLETAQDQIALFQSMGEEAQANYLMSSLEESKELPQEVDSMVRAWRTGDTQWFVNQLQRELGNDPHLYQAVLGSRNRKWIPKIESLLDQDHNCLVIVGAGHLVGHDSVIELLKSDGIIAVQH